MKLIRLDSYETAHGGFDVWYDPRRDLVVQAGRDDLGNAFEDESPADEFIEDLEDDGDDYMAALVESVRQSHPEIMVKWGISVEAWEQARKRGDLSKLRDISRTQE